MKMYAITKRETSSLLQRSDSQAKRTKKQSRKHSISYATICYDEQHSTAAENSELNNMLIARVHASRRKNLDGHGSGRLASVIEAASIQWTRTQQTETNGQAALNLDTLKPVGKK